MQTSTKVELLLNLKAAKALGLAVPVSLLGRADELIAAGSAGHTTVDGGHASVSAIMTTTSANEDQGLPALTSPTSMLSFEAHGAMRLSQEVRP